MKAKTKAGAALKFKLAQLSGMTENIEYIVLPEDVAVKVSEMKSGHYPVTLTGWIWKDNIDLLHAAKLDDEDFERVAKAIGCDIAAVKAVTEIESRGSGFLDDNRPVILFEAHWFGKYTKYKYNSSHPNISATRWDKSLYGKGGVHQWDRLNQAIAINREAALLSTSWGIGQVMGFNHKLCGYSDVETFVDAMHISEGNQLDAMFAFIKSKGLGIHLANRDWAKFAHGYNGSGFRRNQYDTKLAAAYKKHL